MNELQIFENKDFGKVRTISEGDKVLFCGKDVAEALGYAKPRNAIEAHCRYALKRGVGVCTGTRPDGTPIMQTVEMTFIPESDVYRLGFGSNLPSAERFTDWVADEVLPTIRKTGGYVNNDELFISNYLPYADAATQDLFRATLGTIRSLNAKIEADRPKVLFADAVSASETTVLIGELAKILRQNGVEIGQKRLFEWLRNNGYLIRRSGSDYNMPAQRAMELGLFRIKETAITHSDGSVTVSKTVKVTGKGVQYFIDKFLGKKAAV